MKQRQRKQFGSTGNLVIKGTGYMGFDNTSCHRLQSALPSATMMPRRAATRRTMSTSTTITKTALRKSGSIGNIRNAITSSTPPIKTALKETRGYPDQQNDVVQPAAHLQEQYARQLQQQIYLLELENDYLKHSAGKASRKNDKNDDSYHSDTSPSPSLTINLDVSREQESSRADIPDDDKEEKPWRIRKRVSYAQPEVTETCISSNNYDVKPSSYTTDQAELLQKLEESYQRERKMEERLKQKTTEIERIAYENTQLSDYIEELSAKLQKSEENFARDKRALMEEVVELQRRLDYLTPALADKESYMAKIEIEKDELADKLRHATNQLNEVQMTIDEKSRGERALFNVEEERKNETNRLLNTIRHFENMLKEMENKETSLINDIASMKRSLREEQLTAKKDKAVAEKTLEENNALIKENSHLSAEITRLEMRVRTLNQQIDHAQEKEIKPTEIASMRESEKSLKMELLKAEERLKTEKERGQRVILELEQYRKAEEGAKESRGRMQKELDALKVLSESLSNENRSLRQEKFILAERCEELLKKGNSLTDNVTNLTTDVESLKEINFDVHQKMDEKAKEVEYLQEQNHDLLRKVKNHENELQKCKERYDNIERKYKETFEELERQMIMRQEKSEEYEKLAKRILELSDSVRDRKPASSSALTHSSKLSTPGPSKSFLNQPSPIPELSTAVQQTSKRIQTSERKIP